MTRAALLLLASALLRAETHYLTIVGLGGLPDYDKRFEEWAGAIEKSLPGSQVLRGATRETVRASLDALAKKTAPGDALVVMLIGHGTFDGRDYRYNLRGPDLTAAELAVLLDHVPAGRQLVVNMTSASGASLEALARRGRVVITATKTGTEKNATVFARYWTEALRDPAADTDKNESVSALEAFRYAEQKAKQYFEENKRLATEHARLEGDGAGSFVLARYGRTSTAYTDPAKRALLARREELERKIDDLKMRKAAMPAPDYKRELTALLLELARAQEALDK